MLAEIWFAILALVLTTYAVMDGFDFGAGILHLFVARTDAERRTVMAAIGPFWDGNEVWLIAAGGVLFVAFPAVLAAAFSGFYLALFLVLWSLILRGASMEFRSHISDPMWSAFWDALFAGSSALLALLFGVALGNVVRGVPVDESGQFALAFFTTFGTRGEVGLLDWYTLSVGVLALVALAAHGSTFLTYKTEGELAVRCRRAARVLWPLSALLFVVVSIETAVVRPELLSALLHRPIAWLGAALAALGALLLITGARSSQELRAFLGSCLLLYGLLGAAAAALYPVILPSTLKPEFSLTAERHATAAYGLRAALFWWPLAFALAIFYFVTVYRRHRGKVKLGSETYGP